MHQIFEFKNYSAKKSIFLTFFIFFFSQVIFTQQSENFFLPPYTSNGIEVTNSESSNSTVYPYPYSSCGFTIPANSIYLGSSGEFSYKLHFSKPIRKIEVIITASGNPGEESFFFNTNMGPAKIIDVQTCFSRIEKNEIISGLNSVPEGGGGKFSIESDKGFTSLTISGPGGLNGSIFAFGKINYEEKCLAQKAIVKLKSNFFETTCKEQEFDLGKVEISNNLKNLQLSWHQSPIATDSNKLTNLKVKEGTYYAFLFDQENLCYSEDFKAFQIKNSQNFKLETIKQIEVCKGDSIALMASGAKNYIWDNNVKQGEKFIASESKFYIVEGTNEFGCKDTASVFVQVNSLPDLFAGEDISLEKNKSIKLIAEGAKSYLWNENVVQGMEFNPSESKNYIVQGTDEKGCINYDTVFVKIEDESKRVFEDFPIENFDSNYFNPVNVTFLLDVSTSMAKEEKFELLKISLRKMVDLLRPIDKISIIIYSDEATVLVSNLSGLHKSKIYEIIDKLKISGKSEGIKAIKRGFNLAKQNYITGGSNQLIMLTDGAFNYKNDNYLKLIENYQKKNITFSVVGIKNTEKNEYRMQMAAQNGNGAFIPILNKDDATIALVQSIKLFAFKY